MVAILIFLVSESQEDKMNHEMELNPRCKNSEHQ